MILFCSVLVVLVAVPGDPLPPLATVWVAGGSALITLMTVIPAPLPLPGFQNWGHSACILPLGFLCVRGRSLSAWVGLGGGIAACTAWFATHGSTVAQGFSTMFTDVGVLALSSVFAVTLRPAARAVYALRDARVAQNAELAARVAAAHERESQLDALDRSARPLLSRIAAGSALTLDERRECAVVEAGLRDSLRAPRLTHPSVVRATVDARRRGVDVVLIDDSGPRDPAGPDIDSMPRIADVMVEVLDSTITGSVRIRLLPPGRTASASVIVLGDEASRRVDLDREGRPLAAPHDTSSRTSTPREDRRVQ